MENIRKTYNRDIIEKNNYVKIGKPRSYSKPFKIDEDSLRRIEDAIDDVVKNIESNIVNLKDENQKIIGNKNKSLDDMFKEEKQDISYNSYIR